MFCVEDTVSIFRRIAARLVNASGNNLAVDTMTRAQVGIDYEHHEIHGGGHFFISDYATFSAVQGRDFQVTTPAGSKHAHMTFEFASTGACTLDVYEGATVGAGTGITAINSNRNSSNTSILTLQYDGAVSVAGTKILGNAWGFAEKPSKATGGAVSRENELILKSSTTYRFNLQSDSNANIVSFSGQWYEHTDLTD